MVMSDQQARLSGRKGDAGPRAVCCWRFRFLGSSEGTEPIAPDQSARRNGNLHRTLIGPAIDATAIADCLLSANWPCHWNWSNFRPTATRFEDEAMVGNATLFGWTSHATSLHEALDEEADSNNSFHRFHALYRVRTRSVSVLAAVQVLARPLRSVQTPAPPPADKL